MYNFAISKDTYTAVIKWLETLNEYDDSYEKMRIIEIKTRRIQQKAVLKSDKTPGQQISYMEIEPKSKEVENNLNLDLIIEYIRAENEDLRDGLLHLSETINYFIGEEDDENSIEFIK